MPKNCKTFILGKHQLIERFFVVTILKFSLFSACKSVHGEENYFLGRYCGLTYQKLCFFIVFLMISEKNMINDLEKMYILLSFESFKIMIYIIHTKNWHYTVKRLQHYTVMRLRKSFKGF